jgi:hypothetical protein
MLTLAGSIIIKTKVRFRDPMIVRMKLINQAVDIIA